MRKILARYEGRARSILRIVLGGAISLHGFHKLFGFFDLGGRRGNPVVAMETLPQFVGVLELVGGLMLAVGLFVIPVATLLCAETIWAYFNGGLPNGILPMRNGSQESTIVGFLVLYFAFAGAGTWSIDHWLDLKNGKQATAEPPAGLRAWAPTVLSVVRIALALLFFQHGLEKFFAIPRRNPGPPMPVWSQRWWSAVLEFYGGLALAAGLFPRTIAFILCGEMAVAYFISWVPQGKWIPITGSEECALFCYAFLWLVAAGPGPVSVEAFVQRWRKVEKIEPATAPALR